MTHVPIEDVLIYDIPSLIAAGGSIAAAIISRHAKRKTDAIESKVAEVKKLVNGKDGQDGHGYGASDGTGGFSRDRADST